MAIGRFAVLKLLHMRVVVQDERVRIGQAIHEVIGHQLSVMVLVTTALELACRPVAERVSAYHDSVAVEVTNRRPAERCGMAIGGSQRELAERQGGRLTYANVSGGGFGIRAELPVRGTGVFSGIGAM